MFKEKRGEEMSFEPEVRRFGRIIKRTHSERLSKFRKHYAQMSRILSRLFATQQHNVT